jgi:5-(carboxyamino)imidazole ribonucleotide synthase
VSRLAADGVAAAAPGESRRDRARAPPFIAPGATLGVLGGGQLGRMFAHAAQRVGYAVAVLDPDPASPAGRIAHEHIRTAYLDADGLARLAAHAAAITTEFENVPAAALETLAALRPVSPGAAAVAVCQDRALEKAAFRDAGVPCVAHAVIASAHDLDQVDATLLPGILKTARLGYDGKGQQRVADRAALASAFAALGGVACVLEQRVTLAAEISVIVARDASGATVHLPVQENRHRDGILAVTRVPAQGMAALHAEEAIALARRVAEAIDYVGVLCVEFFVLADGSLLANEMAPRPHNSGHYSIDACDLSQFDLQVRVMTGAPLVAPRLHSPAVMLNLLGDLWFHHQTAAPAEPDWRSILALPGAHLHLYGKADARPGRKMGHLTLTAGTAADAATVARTAGRILGIDSEP